MPQRPAESGTPDRDRSVTVAEVNELALSRLSNEGDVLFWARYALQKIDRHLEARENLNHFRQNGSNSEVIRKAESAERFSAFVLEGAAQQLRESLAEQLKSKQEIQ